jgi:hypothetical protein
MARSDHQIILSAAKDPVIAWRKGFLGAAPLGMTNL